MSKLFFVLWPSFLVAGFAEFVFFTLVDPQALYLFDLPTTFSRVATYSIGFFAFWAICAASSFSSRLNFSTIRDGSDLPFP